MKNIKPSLTFKKLDTSSTKIEGTTVAKSKLTIKIGKKTYKGKAKKNGQFSFGIKLQKAEKDCTSQKPEETGGICFCRLQKTEDFDNQKPKAKSQRYR